MASPHGPTRARLARLASHLAARLTPAPRSCGCLRIATRVWPALPAAQLPLQGLQLSASFSAAPVTPHRDSRWRLL